MCIKQNLFDFILNSFSEPTCIVPPKRFNQEARELNLFYKCLPFYEPMSESVRSNSDSESESEIVIISDSD